MAAIISLCLMSTEYVTETLEQVILLWQQLSPGDFTAAAVVKTRNRLRVTVGISA